MELEAKAKRDGLWEAFRQGYPSIARMDQGLAREELDALALDDAEWAISVLPALRKELTAPKAPAPRGAHLWLRKQMFRNFVRGKPEALPAEGHWIAEGSDDDRALLLVRNLCGALSPWIRSGADGGRGYFSLARLGPDLLAMLDVADQSPPRWPLIAKDTPQWYAWQQRFKLWTGRPRSSTIGSDDAIRVPWPWPPARDGRIYDDPEQPPDAGDSEDDDADRQ